MGRGPEPPPVATVADVMSRPLVTAPFATPLATCVVTMAQRGISSLVLTDPDGRLAAILSERDVLSALGANLDAPLDRLLNRSAEDTSPRHSLLHVTPDLTVLAALDTMAHGRIGHLPVLDADGTPLGMVTELDLLRHLDAYRRGIHDEHGGPGATHAPRPGAPPVPQVQQHMVRDVLSANVNATLRTCIHRMTERGVGSIVLISPGGQPVDIVTESDVVRALADGLATERLASLWTDWHQARVDRHLHLVEPTLLLTEAIAIMTRFHIKHLPVRGRGSTLAGLIAERDVLATLAR